MEFPAQLQLGSGHAAITWLAVEAAIVVSQAAARRGFEVAESFLGTLLGHRALDEDFWRKGRGWDVCRWVGWGIRCLGFNDRYI